MPPDRLTVGEAVSRLARLHSDPITPPTEVEIEEAEREVNRALDRHIGKWMRGVEIVG